MRARAQRSKPKFHYNPQPSIDQLHSIQLYIYRSIFILSREFHGEYLRTANTYIRTHSVILRTLSMIWVIQSRTIFAIAIKEPPGAFTSIESFWLASMWTKSRFSIWDTFAPDIIIFFSQFLITFQVFFHCESQNAFLLFSELCIVPGPIVLYTAY